jgi:hypothetical protein
MERKDDILLLSRERKVPTMCRFAQKVIGINTTKDRRPAVTRYISKRLKYQKGLAGLLKLSLLFCRLMSAELLSRRSGQVFFPVLLGLNQVVRDIQENAAGGTHRFLIQLHMGLLRRTAGFFAVTGSTGANQIFPGMPTALVAGFDMVQSQLTAHLTAILTGIVIAIKDFYTGQFRLGTRPFDQTGQFNNRGDGKGVTRGMYISVAIFQHLCFAGENQG